ncbi:hypothetical protein PENTCL1PPCAC_4653, partial [Pristionchus entomophagus]
ASSENPREKLSLREQVGAMASVLVHPRLLLFLPRFISHGLFVSFYMIIYPSTLQYSSILASRYPMLTAYYAFAMCAGCTFGGFLIAPLNRRLHDFGLRPLYYITAGVQLITYAIATLSVPNWSTARPSSESAYLEPHVVWVCVISFLLGFADTTNTASNSVICSRMIRGRASHTYAAARFYFGVAAAVVLFCSPMLSMRLHAVIFASVTIISMLSYNFAVNHLEIREDPTKKENLEPQTSNQVESRSPL